MQDASILFVDSPVGAGFSYVDDERAYTTDVGQVAADLLVLLTEFLRQNPTYVVSGGAGGGGGGGGGGVNAMYHWGQG